MWLLRRTQSEVWKTILLYIAEELAKSTENDLDDQIVQLLKEKLKRN